MSELVGVWASLGVALSLLVVQGVALLVSFIKRSSLEREHADLAQGYAQLRQLQNEQIQEVCELRSALRAERAHVIQLVRKTELMKLMHDELLAQHTGS